MVLFEVCIIFFSDESNVKGLFLSLSFVHFGVSGGGHNTFTDIDLCCQCPVAALLVQYWVSELTSMTSSSPLGVNQWTEVLFRWFAPHLPHDFRYCRAQLSSTLSQQHYWVVKGLKHSALLALLLSLANFALQLLLLYWELEWVHESDVRLRMTHQTLSRVAQQQHVGTADAQALKLSSGNVMLRSLSTTDYIAQHFYELREASLLCQTVRDISQHADALNTTYQGWRINGQSFATLSASESFDVVEPIVPSTEALSIFLSETLHFWNLIESWYLLFTSVRHDQIINEMWSILPR